MHPSGYECVRMRVSKSIEVYKNQLIYQMKNMVSNGLQFQGAPKIHSVKRGFTFTFKTS